MAGREGPRPGGRSARVQASVHKAVQDLITKMDRADLTIPIIAAEAGVTPSTIYRRWGDLQELLADVAVERLRPDMEPVDTGSGPGDLQAWAEQYAEEMSSNPGREMIRDVLSSQDGSGACQCCNFTKQQIEVIVQRAKERGEAFPEVETIMDRVVSPIMYRILFGEAPDAARIERLVTGVTEQTSPTPAFTRKSA